MIEILEMSLYFHSFPYITAEQDVVVPYKKYSVKANILACIKKMFK